MNYQDLDYGVDSGSDNDENDYAAVDDQSEERRQKTRELIQNLPPVSG